MSVVIELPHVGESVVEGTIGKWLKKPGDVVQRYEPLVEVVTDKVTLEVPSPVTGSLIRVLAEEGETIPMGAPIAEMESDEVPPPTPPAPTPELVSLGSQGSEAPVGTTGYLVKNSAPVGPTGGGPPPEADTDAPPQVAPAVDVAAVTQVVNKATQAVAEVAASPADSGVRLSPAVRRLVQENGIDIGLIQGTGMGGRITRDDVLKYIESRPKTEASAIRATAPAYPAPEAGQDEEHIALTPIRQMIAEAMIRSVTEIPHAWSTVEVDVTGLVALRSRIRGDFQQREGLELTYLPFVIKAVVESLKEHRTLNASWGGDKIIIKNRINLGIAVAASDGLIVPVIHDADRMSIAGLARSLNDIAQRARQKKLTLVDVQGGTFTLNNTGTLGSSVSQPIINYPQAGIMTTEAIVKRPVVRDDAIAIRSMMNLCLSFDHRINDGAESSGFLQAVKSRLEAMGPDTAIY